MLVMWNPEYSGREALGLPSHAVEVALLHCVM